MFFRFLFIYAVIPRAAIFLASGNIAEAQQNFPNKLRTQPLAAVAARHEAFLQGSAERTFDRLSTLMAEIVRLNVDIIVSHGRQQRVPPMRAVKTTTSTIPIVMGQDPDPIGKWIRDQSYAVGRQYRRGIFVDRGLIWKAVGGAQRNTATATKKTMSGQTEVGQFEDLLEGEQSWQEVIQVNLPEIKLKLLTAFVTAPSVVAFHFSAITVAKPDGLSCKELKRLYRVSFKPGLLPFRL